jgi:hypothetical protein
VRALVRGYWLDRPKPIHGVERILFCTLLLLAAVVSPLSPLRAWTSYRDTAPEWLPTLGAVVVDPALLENVALTLVAVWLAAIAGLFTRVALVALALGAVGLHFITSPVVGSTAWHLPVYALVALALSRSSDRFCWDGRRRPVDPPAADVGSSGLARRLILVAVVGYEFAAGCAKLRDAGIGWADGQTLAAALPAEPEGLAAWLVANPSWILAASVVTLVAQVGAPLALVSRASRVLLAPVWLLIHLVDFGLLGSDELANAVVVAFVVLGRGTSPMAPRHGVPWPRAVTPVQLVGAALASVAGLLLLAMGPLGIARWPGAEPNRHSAYVGRGLYAGVWEEELERPDRMMALAERCAVEPCHPALFDRIVAPFRLRLIARKKRRRLELRGGLGTASAETWRRLLGPVVVAEVVSRDKWPPAKVKQRGDDKPSGTVAPATAFLLRTLDILADRVASPAEFRRLELVYRHGKRDVVVAQVPVDIATVSSR